MNNYDIQKAIDKLESNIEEKQAQIDLIKEIDFCSIDEATWHKICETPLRNSDILATIVGNIFKDATDIKVGYNYVMFELYGFKCYLPTSQVNGIEIDTDWYRKDNGKPSKEKFYYSDKYNMKKYFDALDNHESWKVLFKYRFPSLNGYKTWVKFVLWFGK